MKISILLILLCLVASCTSTEDSTTGELIEISDMKFNFTVEINSRDQVVCKAVFLNANDGVIFRRLLLSRGEKIYCNGVELKRPREIFSSHYEARLDYKESNYTFSFVRENSGRAYFSTVEVPNAINAVSPVARQVYNYGEKIQILWSPESCCSFEVDLLADQYAALDLKATFKASTNNEKGTLSLTPQISITAPESIEAVLRIKRVLKGYMNALDGEISAIVVEDIPLELRR